MDRRGFVAALLAPLVVRLPHGHLRDRMVAWVFSRVAEFRWCPKVEPVSYLKPFNTFTGAPDEASAVVPVSDPNRDEWAYLAESALNSGPWWSPPWGWGPRRPRSDWDEP